jgi:hypothetical protein
MPKSAAKSVKTKKTRTAFSLFRVIMFQHWHACLTRLRLAMKIFDILAEAKIRDFESRQRNGVSESGTPNAAEYVRTESFEKQLLQEIYKLIQGGNDGMLKRAKELEIQLLASLEKQGLNLTAKRIADEIAEILRERSR